MVEVAVKSAATDKSQESWEFSDSESWSNHEKEATGKPVASINSGKSGNSKSWKQQMAAYFLQVSSSSTSHGESLFDRTTGLWPMSNGCFE